MMEFIRSAFWWSLETIGQSAGGLWYGLVVIICSAYWIFRSEGWARLKKHVAKVSLEFVSIAVLAWIPFFLWGLVTVKSRGLQHAQEQVISKTAGFHYRFTIKTGKVIQRPSLLLEFNNPIVLIGKPILYIKNAGVMSNSYRVQDKHFFIDIDFPPITPETPLYIAMSVKEPLKLVNVDKR